MRVAVASLLIVAAALAAAHAPGATPTASCERPRIGFLGPLTGDAVFIGKEQLGLARYAARTLGARVVRVVEADTQLDPARAAAAARVLRSNPRVLAVVGPAGSQEVLAAAPVLTRGDRLAFVSGSALAAELTNGSIPTFFRVVPNERAQAPTVARLLIDNLAARSVAIVDDGTTYSRRLADRVQTRLRARGVEVARSAVDPNRTDFAADVARVPARADAVFLPWHVAATAQLFGEQLRASGRHAAIVGSDTLDSRDFTIPGAYVVTFAPRVRVPGYEGRAVSKFGPPAYVAAEVAVRAVRAACADGRATRREVLERIRATDLPRTVLGGRLRFTRRGDVRGASYVVVRVAG